MVEQRSAPQPARVAAKEDAERLVAGVLSALEDLERLLEAETAHLRVGRLREGLAQEVLKNELTAVYMRGLESVKANVIALARFAPDSLERLRTAHQRFSQVVEANRIVLATARAVSESLVKGIAEEMNRHARPQGYAPAGAIHGARSQAEPLVVSRSL